MGKTRESTKAKKKAFLLVLANKAGNVSEACKAVGIVRDTYYDWAKRDPKFSARCKEVHESLIDFAESKLMVNISQGKEASIFFFLKCRAKDRGYVERHEVSGPDGGPIHHALDELSEEALRALAGRSRRGVGTPVPD